MADKFEPFNIEKSCSDLQRVPMSELKIDQPILFDTNFLFVCFKQGIDIIREVERLFGRRPQFFIMEGTISELKSIDERKDKDKKFLPLISKMLHTYEFKILESRDTYVDREIIKNLSDNVVVATNDKELKKKIKSKGAKIIYMRQEQYLVLE